MLSDVSVVDHYFQTNKTEGFVCVLWFAITHFSLLIQLTEKDIRRILLRVRHGSKLFFLISLQIKLKTLTISILKQVPFRETPKTSPSRKVCVFFMIGILMTRLDSCCEVKGYFDIISLNSVRILLSNSPKAI